MRDWRKLHKAILTSDRMPDCSFAALWLWVLLVCSQDDEANYPWTRSKVAALTAAYGWDYEEASALAEQLVQNGVAEWQGQFLHLTNGEAYNGQPTYAKQAFIYQEPHNGHKSEAASDKTEVAESTGLPRPSLSLSDTESGSVGGRGKGIARGKGPKPIDDDFIERMVKEYSEHLGGEAEVRQRIATAMNHTASKKWIDKQRGVQDWLRKDAEKRANGTATRDPQQARASSDSWRGLPFPDR